MGTLCPLGGGEDVNARIPGRHIDLVLDLEVGNTLGHLVLAVVYMNHKTQTWRMPVGVATHQIHRLSTDPPGAAVNTYQTATPVDKSEQTLF